MNDNLLRTGIYTVSEAARLTRVSPSRIRRWLKGYEFPVKHGRHRSPAIWRSQLDPLDHALALGFLDLLEVRCVDAFISVGVSWKTLRLVHERACRLVGHEHPFCTNLFATDGQTIFMKVRQQTGDVALWDIRDVQRVFKDVIEPFLRELEFGEGGGVPSRWWPRGRERLVALDPRRCFGEPIIFNDGVPTAVLARSVAANGSVDVVAHWFQIPSASVRAAVEFERSLAA